MALPVGDIDAVALALIVEDDVIDGVTVALSDIDDVPLTDPPKLSDDIEVVAIVLIVDDGVIGGLPVALNDAEGVPIADPP